MTRSLLPAPCRPLLLALLGLTFTARAADPTRLERLDHLFGTHGPTAEVSASDFLRARLEQPQLHDALLRVLLRSIRPAEISVWPGVALKQGKDGGGAFFYLGTPCGRSERVSVRPWWDPRKPVSICKSAYRPEVKSETSTWGTARTCEAVGVLSEGTECGCGEHLLNCARDGAHALEQNRAVVAEVFQTFQYVVQQRRRFSDLFSMNETVRSDLGDFMYRRDRYFRDGRWDAGPLRADGATLRPREPFMAGGILSAPMMQFYDQPRVRVAELFEDLLCMPLTSTAVHAEAMFALASPNFRRGGHLELAQRQGCRSCHARLEYAMRATEGYSNLREGLRFDPAKRSAQKARVYVRDEKDLRAEGPATVEWLGRTLAAQPEFPRCVVSKIEEWIYAGAPVPEATHQKLLEDFTRSEDLAGLLEGTVAAWLQSERPAQRRAEAP